MNVRVVCTTGDRHLLDRLMLPAGSYSHHPTGCPPALLGFECHAVLRDRLGDYDYYAYLEDDLIARDPWLFVKLGVPRYRERLERLAAEWSSG